MPNLNPELIPLLATCYHGLTALVKKKVKDDIKAGMDRNQAIFNAIVEPRIAIYYEKGQKELGGVIAPITTK